MKIRLSGIVLILALCAVGLGCVTVPYQPAQPRPVVVAAPPPGPEDQPFYEDLAPYGDWVQVSGPGWVWAPYGIEAGWRPYQVGHWVLTDYGWTWASEENFGWAVYHYGRWYDDPHYGWVWVPGTEWGPAWVAWHEGGGWVGWAPLPYQVRWRAGFGLDWGGVSINVALGPSAWCFVPARHVIDPGLRYHAAPPARNVTLIQITQNVTNYVYVDNRIVNRSVEEGKIGRAVGHPIPRYRVRQAEPAGAHHGGRVRGDEFELFRPPDTPVRGAKSQGRLVPPGHDESGRAGRDGMNRPGRGRWNENPPETAPGENAPATTRDDGEQQGGRDEQRPSRLRTHGPQRRQGPAPRETATETTTEPSPAPGQDAAPDGASGTRSRGTEAKPRRDASTPANPPEPSTARPADPGRPEPQSVRPGQATGKSEKPGQGKGQQVKSKSRKGGEAARKNGKARPAPAEPEKSDSEKPKPEQPDPEKQD